MPQILLPHFLPRHTPNLLIVFVNLQNLLISLLSHEHLIIPFVFLGRFKITYMRQNLPAFKKVVLLKLIQVEIYIAIVGSYHSNDMN